MRILSPRNILATLAIVALASADSHAGMIVTSMDSSTPIYTFSIPSRGMNGESAYVGPNTIRFDGSAPVAAYCTDFFKSIGANDSYAGSLASLSDLANGGFVAKLFGADAATGDNSAVEKAALQMAIWNSVEAGRAGLGHFVDPLAYGAQRVTSDANHYSVYTDASKSSLLFSVSSGLAVHNADGSGVLDRMSALLHAASSFSGVLPGIQYVRPDSDYGQGFVTAEASTINPGFVPPSIAAVPEPSTLALLATAVPLGLVYWRRRSRTGAATTTE